MTATALATDAVAGYRLTRLLTADTITERPRGAVIRWAYQRRDGMDATYDREAETPFSTWTERATDDDDPPALATLVTCRWCMGVWVGAAVVAARRVAPRAWQPVAEAAVVAAAAALLAGRED